ncbi:MAG TPA: response regulator [Bryobacteraceae bacterium]|nr:response regulator [Bryobacteraceae bacterium]
MKNPSVTPIRILLADDNLHGLQARKMLLQEQGIEVETAPSGEQAWELFQQSHFDIVVTDYRMKQLDGLAFIQLIRASGSSARIIMLSGFVTAIGMTEASTGADEVIAKSNKEIPELLRAVKKLAQMPAKRGPASARSSRARKAASAG